MTLTDLPNLKLDGGLSLCVDGITGVEYIGVCSPDGTESPITISSADFLIKRQACLSAGKSDNLTLVNTAIGTMNFEQMRINLPTEINQTIRIPPGELVIPVDDETSFIFALFKDREFSDSVVLIKIKTFYQRIILVFLFSLVFQYA